MYETFMHFMQNWDKSSGSVSRESEDSTQKITSVKGL